MIRSARLVAAVALLAAGTYAFTRAIPRGAGAGAPAPTAAPNPAAPIYVWIQPASDIAGWAPRNVGEVERAFIAWNGIVPTVRFAFADDSADAAVRVTWLDRFDEQMTGQSRLVRDPDGNVVEAAVRLAVHHPDGRPVDGEALRALAMHEVGHLLGLAHSADPHSIMAPVVRVRGLSAGDSAALRRIEWAEGRD